MEACGVVGETAAMLAVFADVQRLAAVSDLPIVITGETGTGKERMARALHALDEKRRHHPFVAVNCGAIASTIAESELFGHRRGAFTHAHRDRAGLVRAANRGVLFLDEIAELDASIQTKLLRVLQEGRVLAVGDETDVAVDVRIVAATNRPLDALVAEHRFRADLYHRLNVLSIAIPPLRERRSDIPRLVQHFVRVHGARSGRPPASVHPAFMEAVGRLDLPGNARQLENIVCCALVHHDGEGPLDIGDLPAAVWSDLVTQAQAGDHRVAAAPHADAAWTTYPVQTLAAHNWDLSRSLASCERLMVEAALCETRGNQSRAARLLGITARSVHKKLRRYRSA
jgi:DNA-binding NtrC family response regulator